MSTSNPESIGGIVLCGGRSTRMGRAKHELPFGSETMIQRVLRILQPVVSPIVVVAAPAQRLSVLPNDVIVARDEQEDLGPLEGLAVGLSVLRKSVDAAYASSCDVPLLKPEFVRRMIEELNAYDMAIPRDGKYHHPLAAVYRTQLEDQVRSLIAEDRMRPFFLVQQCRAKVVDVEELRIVDPRLDSLRNANTPEEYRVALERAGIAQTETD